MILKLHIQRKQMKSLLSFQEEKIEHLNSEGYKMNEDELDGKAVRLVAAWNTKDSDVEELLNTIKIN